MRLILLDYGGTLSLLPDRVTFVLALRDRGDYPVLHTGTNIAILRKIEPDLCRSVRRIIGKGDMPLDRIPAAIADREPDMRFTEVVVVDDEPQNLRALVELLDDPGPGGMRWRFLYRSDIGSLLGD